MITSRWLQLRVTTFTSCEVGNALLNEMCDNGSYAHRSKQYVSISNLRELSQQYPTHCRDKVQLFLVTFGFWPKSLQVKVLPVFQNR